MLLWWLAAGDPDLAATRGQGRAAVERARVGAGDTAGQLPGQLRETAGHHSRQAGGYIPQPNVSEQIALQVAPRSTVSKRFWK